MKIKYIGDVSPVKIIEDRGIVWETGNIKEVNNKLAKEILNKYPQLFKKSYSKKEKIIKELKEVEK